MTEMKKISFILLPLLTLLLLYGCEKKSKILAPQDQISRVDISLSNFLNVGDTADYALWAAYGPTTDEQTDSIGRFTVDDQGIPSQSSFDVALGTIQQAVNLIISIENADSSIDSASVYRIMAAKLRANNATFSLGTEYLFNFDFSMATAQYQVFAEPGTDSIKGIWFMTGFTDTTHEAGFNLPAVPTSRWKYDVFISVNGQSYSTGFFTNPNIADQSNIYADTSKTKLMPTFSFPGENFQVDTSGVPLNIDLRGAQVIVLIHPPVPPFSGSPFPPLEIFRGTIPADAQPENIYQLDNTSETLPGGSAEVEVKLFE
jgi:hypothetical protein